MDETPAAASISLEANLPLPSSAREKKVGSSRRINVLKVATIMVVVAMAGCIFAGLSEMTDDSAPLVSAGGSQASVPGSYDTVNTIFTSDGTSKKDWKPVCSVPVQSKSPSSLADAVSACDKEPVCDWILKYNSGVKSFANALTTDELQQEICLSVNGMECKGNVDKTIATELGFVLQDKALFACLNATDMQLSSLVYMLAETISAGSGKSVLSTVSTVGLDSVGLVNFGLELGMDPGSKVSRLQVQ
jgi:hypothetical protein